MMKLHELAVQTGGGGGAERFRDLQFKVLKK